jgi:hypothetical protein
MVGPEEDFIEAILLIYHNLLKFARDSVIVLFIYSPEPPPAKAFRK